MENIDSLHKCLLGIMKEIDQLCRENQINYTLMGGSLIGAIRHKGFIPWDDDMDIGMPYSDYIKFLNILKKINHPWITFDSHENDDYEEQFIKVYDSRTTLKECKSQRIKGVFVDVFPIIPIGNGIHISKIRYYYDTILKMARYNLTNNSKSTKSKMFVYKFVGMFYKHNPSRLTRKIQKRRLKFSKKNYKFSYDPDGSIKGIVSSAYFSTYIDCTFENLTFMIIKDYDAYLTHIFGDYMQLPPIDQRVPGHFEILDLEHSYLNYKK